MALHTRGFRQGGSWLRYIAKLLAEVFRAFKSGRRGALWCEDIEHSVVFLENIGWKAIARVVIFFVYKFANTLEGMKFRKQIIRWMKLAYQDSFLSPIKFHLFPVNDYFTELWNSASQPFTANIKTSTNITVALDRRINQVFHFQDVRVALKNFRPCLKNRTHINERTAVSRARRSWNEVFVANISRSKVWVAKKHVLSKSVSRIFNSLCHLKNC